MYELGEVIEVDGVNAKVRVRFTQKKLDSFWLSVLKQNTGDHKYYCMPSVGEVVVCLTDKYCESGIVIGSIYTAKNPPLYDETKIAVNLKDGTSFLYDKESGNININVVGDKTVTIGGKCKVVVAGNADIRVDGNTKLVCEDIEFGTSIMQAAMKSDFWFEFFDKHIHMGNLGAPTSPPQTPATPVKTTLTSKEVKIGG